MLLHGPLLAVIPMVGWALGDFFIQRVTKVVGPVASLWYICALSTLLAPYFLSTLLSTSLSDLFGLTTLAGVIFVYAMVLFKAFEVGKLSITEAVVSFEMPITVGMSVFLFGESITLAQFLLIVSICIGIFLTAIRYLDHITSHKHWFERGALLALVGAVLSAVTNVFVGDAASQVDPFFVIWYTHAVLFLVCTCILLAGQTFGRTVRLARRHAPLVLGMALCDNVAWFGYAYAVSQSSIALTITISEAYIVLAALLGVVINRERLRRHQVLGAVVALSAVVVLTYISV